LGRHLVVSKSITPQALGQALAAQSSFPYQERHPLDFDADLIKKFPRKLALRYGVLPLSSNGKTTQLAVEKFISPVALGAIARQIGGRVEPVMLPSGFVAIALRYWYGPDETRKSDPVLYCLERNPHDAELVTELARYRVLLGDLIQELGMISPQLFAQALFDFNPLKKSIGRFLLERNLISPALLDEAVARQRQFQQQANELILQLSAKNS
jgi:adsorption protein B